ncbi:hypothetical protein [Streptomyces cavernae]|uniref:hypothetical protein n=1 Tax=Streptomyces cavernae TaxID=2259034 RepID=UPI0012D88068|nr:hypothetical protein [Streptomyces cavernae]
MGVTYAVAVGFIPVAATRVTMLTIAGSPTLVTSLLIPYVFAAPPVRHVAHPVLWSS